MINDIIEFCSSEKFLGGNGSCTDKLLEFEHRRPMRWKVYPVETYLDAVVKERNNGLTPWHVLQEKNIDVLGSAVGTLSHRASGDFFCKLDNSRRSLSELLINNPRIEAFAEKIAESTCHDGNLLYEETLGETPYAQLRVALLLQEMLPDVSFPVITTLLDAYENGLMPFGLYDERFEEDETYDEPEIVMCLDPANLEAK